MLMDGFFSKKLYAAKTERTFITKLNTLRCLECTSCATFLSSSLMVSMTDLLRNRILSYNGISLFFILHFKPVTVSIPSLNNLSNKPCEIYPLSANNFPNTLSLNLLKTSVFLSSTFAFVSIKLASSQPRLWTRVQQSGYMKAAWGTGRAGEP